MRRYDLVIFDMDGTILNTLEDLKDSLNVTLTHFGYPERSLDEVRHFVGNGIGLLIKRAVPEGLSPDQIETVHQWFLDYYQGHCAIKTRPYDGIERLLERLCKAGCKTAVVSNKADPAVKELAEQYFRGLFDMAIGERKGIARKPSPDSVNEVIKRCGVKREKAIYIGDSEVDIKTAANAGIQSIIVTWGFRSSKELEEQGATCLAASVDEVCMHLFS